MSNDPQEVSAQPPGRQFLEPGTQVGRFRVEALLGSGGMGEVYRAWDATLERLVALKALRAGEARDTGAPERFRREALALAQLNHPNICQIYDWVDGPGGTFIAMELVEGRPLDQAAPDLRVRDRLQVVRSVALALEAAHARGLVHRDLRPGNILVAPGGPNQAPKVKVLDFGLARLMDPRGPSENQITPPAVPNLALLLSLEEAELRRNPDRQDATATRPEDSRQEASGPHPWSQTPQAGATQNALSYASPEQIQGQAAGPASDLFSLGIVAWELLAGGHPFPGEGRTRMRAIVDGPRRGLKGRGLPAGTAELLRAMLEAHPFKRPTASRVAATLGDLLKPRRLLRWTAIAVAGALLLAVAVNGFLGRGVIADLTRQRPARVAVFPFLNQTGEPRLDPIAGVLVPELLAAALREHPRLAPLDAETLTRARSTLRLSPEGALNPSDQLRLASALGTQLLLRGKLRKGEDGSFALSFELVDASGKVRHAGEARESREHLDISLPLARSASGDLLRAVDPLASRQRPLWPDLPAGAMAAYTRGSALMDRGDFKGAVPAFQEAAQLAPDFVPAVLAEARCLSRLADAAPEPVFQWARWAARAQGNRFGEMAALHFLAIRLGERGLWEASDQAARAALDLARTLGDASFEASAHATLGVNLQGQHRPAEAEAECQQALAIFRTVGDRLSASRTLKDLAGLEKDRGRLKDAEADYLGALQAVQAFGDRWGESSLTHNLGDLAMAQEGGLDRAEAFYRKALALHEAIGDQDGLASTLLGLASVFQARGDLDRAEGMVRQCLELARRNSLRPAEALACYRLGELSRTSKKNDAARGYYQQSLTLHHELRDPVMEARCLAGEAECLARDGHRGMARALLARSRELSAVESPYLLRAQAWLARSEGHADEARALFGRALLMAPLRAPEIVRELKEAAG